MYKDIISYKLAENISEEHLLSVCKDIVKNWMSKQSGFVRWEIHKNNNGVGYTDIVYWESKNDAKKAGDKHGQCPQRQLLVLLLRKRFYLQPKPRPASSV